METFLIKAVQLIMAFAILVIIHEFGHFFFARLFGVRVEKFYIFFDPWTELFRWKPRKYIGGFGKKHSLGKETENNETEAEDESREMKKESWLRRFWGHTEYGVGWLPLGGYCKISGMIDESMDKEQMKQPPKEWEFRTKPAWQRLLIMIAGVLFNFLLAIIIYAGIVYATGEKYVRLQDTSMGMDFSPVAKQIGFHDGDIPILADGKEIDDPADAMMQMLQSKTVSVLRNGDTVNVKIPEKFLFAIDKEMQEGNTPIRFFTYRFPTRVTQVVAGEGAEKSGMKAGDEIIAIDSVSTPTIYSFLTTLEGNADKTVQVTLLRPKDPAKGSPVTAGAPADTLRLPVKLSSGSKMGIGLEVDPSAFYPTQEKRYTLLGSVPRGIEMGTDKLTSYAKSMKLVFTKEGAKSVGGFGAIGSIFPEKWDWIAFWNIAAFLSVALAFMNILPIPALDGGHVMFLLYEVIFRRKPSEKFMEYAQMIGMGLLILLLLYANGMDIVRLFK